jgi:ABC-2 type transport system ATP-binding protein
MIVTFQDVSLEFSKNTGVYNIDLEIPESSIVGLIGPSGCGKSTLLKLMVGLLKPDKGEILVLGAAPQDFKLKERRRFAYVPQSFVLYPNLTVVENLRFVAAMFGLGPFARRKPISQALKVVELNDVRNRLAQALSGGMQHRLQLAAGLLHNPQLIIADEPTAGVDPMLRANIWDYFSTLKDQGKTIVLATQYVDEATNCDRVGIMNAGRLLRMASPEVIQQHSSASHSLDITLKGPQVLETLERLQSVDFVQDAYRLPENPRVVRVQVLDPGRDTPVLLDLLKVHSIDVEAIEQVHASFDDVLHAIVKESDNA